ncbi:hypothetical protein EV378_0431 [Pseudonocardia endophytica]|uniref:Uncharacterized protein n=1 Tax=Pseudonocardia endophytica TaxID=401976 RepID=A0A4R1HX71_PSEEN|nr:hypothetical protein EV378_0431 [Pseudonocardia endophytica]
MAGRLIVWWYGPARQLGLVSTGLIAVVGNTFWQVTWLIGIAGAMTFHVVRGPSIMHRGGSTGIG